MVMALLDTAQMHFPSGSPLLLRPVPSRWSVMGIKSFKRRGLPDMGEEGLLLGGFSRIVCSLPLYSGWASDSQ